MLCPESSLVLFKCNFNKNDLELDVHCKRCLHYIPIEHSHRTQHTLNIMKTRTATTRTTSVIRPMRGAALSLNLSGRGLSLGHGSNWSQCFAYEPKINPGRESMP